jgi:RNHCP domain
LPRIRYEEPDDVWTNDDVDEINQRRRMRTSNNPHPAFGHPLPGAQGEGTRSVARKPRVADGSESFKCGHCRAFIGPTVSGGRHRNHCPLCLYSRHVDDRRPGDRASICRSLMAPVGTFHRPKGEQVILHRCLGCGLERHCRVAADDNMIGCLRLPLVAPRTSRPMEVVEEEGVA